MRKELLKLNRKTKIISLFLLLFPIASMSGEKLPPILDFYPVCQYKTLNTVSVKKRIKDSKSNNSAVTVSEQQLKEKRYAALLNKLRKKAQEQNADALILVARQNKKSKLINQKNTTMLTFEAELVSECNNLSEDTSRPAKFNHKGMVSKKAYFESTKKTAKVETYQILLPVKRLKYRHPVISDKNVSLTDGVYGVKLGFSYQQVLEVLGDPSIQLSIFKNQFVVGYGRHHWFYFQSDKLVKIDTTSSPVSINLVNRISFRDFFDDNLWKIDQRVPHGIPLAKVRKLLSIHSTLSKKNQLVIKQSGRELRLKFDTIKNFGSEKRSYKLDGFSLQTASYRSSAVKADVGLAAQYKVIENVLMSLDQGEPVDMQPLAKQLGNPVGKIFISGEKQLVIFNPYLVTEIDSGDLSKILLSENLFDSGNGPSNKTEPWNIAGFKQGTALEQLRNQLPEDAFEWDGKVEFESDSYQTALTFEQKGKQQVLYEMEISL